MSLFTASAASAISSVRAGHSSSRPDVTAPTEPMIGSPRAFMAWKRAGTSERGKRGIRLYLCSPAGEAPTKQPTEFGDYFLRKSLFIDMRAQSDESARGGLPDGCFE
jgi:hypothetical protein